MAQQRDAGRRPTQRVCHLPRRWADVEPDRVNRHFGTVLGHAGAFALRSFYPTLPAYPPAWAVIAALGSAMATGLLFGVMPARRAALLDPVNALAKR